ncbi:MAG: FISUMP domain-containing protein, partial [Bacteroidota bacterium]
AMGCFLSCSSNDDDSNTETSDITDIDGNIYRTVQIGDQIWMAENLKVTRDMNGNAIASFTPNNNPDLIDVYGRLYNWESALNACPRGWRLPNSDDWFLLLSHIDPNINNPSDAGNLGENVGGELKSTSDLWSPPNQGANNLSGFSALPSGFFQNNNWLLLGSTTNFWSATEGNSDQAFGGINLSSNSNTVFRGYMNKNDGHCIRCIKIVD